MSYETKIDEMVGRHVAEFQQELSLARILRNCLKKTPAMPYGYPLRVWCPRHVCQSPRKKPFVPHGPHTLSNGVPWALRLSLVDDYVLGLYNPYRCGGGRPVPRRGAGSGRSPGKPRTEQASLRSFCTTWLWPPTRRRV